MKRMLVAALCAPLCVGLGAAAPQDDAWEFAEDAAQELTVAAVRYDGGQMIVAQCRRGGLTLVVAGLPASAEMLRLAASRSDGRAADQVWLSAGAPGAYRSASPGRDARFLRGGGSFAVRPAADAPAAVSGDFDLPAESGNLDRVLTACGWALEDDRDLLPEAEVLLDRPRRGREPPAYRPPAAPEREVSCIVREMRLRDCRADHPPYAGSPGAASLLRDVEGRQVFAPIGADPAGAEGKVFHVIASNQLLVVRR